MPWLRANVLLPAAKPASGLQSNKQTQDQLFDTQKTKPTTTLPSTKRTALCEGLQVLHKKNGTPTTLFVPERCDAFGIKDQELLKTLLTSLRIHSWVNVKVGDVPLRIVSAVMPLPIASPQFEGKPLMPLRHPAITFPPGDFFSQYHVVVNSENDTTSQKFLNHGLYFSTQMADANIISFSKKIYVIPNASIDTFFANLVERGVESFQGFDYFDDPTADLTDAHGLIAERGSKKNSKAGLAPIRSTPLADEHTPSVTKDDFQVPTEVQTALFRFIAGLFMFLFGGIVVFLFGVAYLDKGALEIQYAGYLIFIWIPMTALGGYLVCTTPLRKTRNTIKALQHAHNNEQAALAQKTRPSNGKAAELAAKQAQSGFSSQLLSVADIQRNDQEMGEIYLRCPKCSEEERINDMGKMMLKHGNNVFSNYKCKKCGVVFDGAKHNVNRNA